MAYLRNQEGHIRRNRTNSIPKGVHRSNSKSFTIRDASNIEASKIAKRNSGKSYMKSSVSEEINKLEAEIRLLKEQSKPTESIENRLERYRSIEKNIKAS